MADDDYRLKLAMHAKLTQGGYWYEYEILYQGQRIGDQIIVKETRASKEQVAHILGDGEAAQEFATAAEFKAAHQARLQVLGDAE